MSRRLRRLLMEARQIVTARLPMQSRLQVMISPGLPSSIPTPARLMRRPRPQPTALQSGSARRSILLRMRRLHSSPRRSRTPTRLLLPLRSSLRKVLQSSSASRPLVRKVPLASMMLTISRFRRMRLQPTRLFRQLLRSNLKRGLKQ